MFRGKMAVDLKQECTRPLALILAVLAALGWLLFGLSSLSAASVQRAQRIQIMETTERNEKLAADLARQVAAAGALADLEAKAAATRDDLTRVTQARADAQTELTTTQKTLTAMRRDLSEVDRNIQNQKAGELDPSPADTTAAAAAPAPAPAPAAGRGGARRGWGYGRGRSYRSYSIRTR